MHLALGKGWLCFVEICQASRPKESGKEVPFRPGPQEPQEGGFLRSGRLTLWGRTLRGAILALVRSDERYTEEMWCWLNEGRLTVPMGRIDVSGDCIGSE